MLRKNHQFHCHKVSPCILMIFFKKKTWYWLAKMFSLLSFRKSSWKIFWFHKIAFFVYFFCDVTNFRIFKFWSKISDSKFWNFWSKFRLEISTWKFRMKISSDSSEPDSEPSLDSHRFSIAHNFKIMRFSKWLRNFSKFWFSTSGWLCYNCDNGLGNFIPWHFNDKSRFLITWLEFKPESFNPRNHFFRFSSKTLKSNIERALIGWFFCQNHLVVLTFTSDIICCTIKSF